MARQWGGAAKQQAAISRKLTELCGGIGWYPQNGLCHCTIASRSASLVKAVLEDSYGIQAQFANGMLTVSLRDGPKILATKGKFANAEEFRDAAAKFITPTEVPSENEPTQPEPLTQDDVLSRLHKYTKTSWSLASDQSVSYAGMLATVPDSKKLTEAKQRRCTQIGLTTELIDTHGKFVLAVAPEAAEAFVEKKLARDAARQQGSHAEQAATVENGGLSR